MNSVNLYGRVCQDMELAQEGKGKDATSYVRFTLAVGDGVDRNGEKKTQFIPCVAWGSLAETLCDYVLKGDRLTVEGRINIQSYEDEDGNKRSSFQITVLRADFVETKAESDEKTEKKSDKRKR